MQNLLIGSSGSGKSYEAVVYHVLPALEKGRKVITNLPLNLEYFYALNPAYEGLIEIRRKPLPIKGTWQPTHEENAFQLEAKENWIKPEKMARCFASVWDYYDDWRHPVNGTGALFIVDEAQNVIPVRGTKPEVEEWTALHRHWRQDVYYISQSFRKLNVAIRENVQMVYRFRKKTAWGQPTKYIRKVQDGTNGEVLNTTERTYESQYFAFYKSHTQSDGVGEESNADDIVPIWQHWSFKGAAILFTILIIMLLSGKVKNPLKAPVPTKTPITDIQKQVRDSEISQASKNQLKTNVTNKRDELNAQENQTIKVDDEPLTNRGIHIAGHLKSATKEVWTFSISQNGQHAYYLDDKALKTAGYKLEVIDDCLILVKYKDKIRSLGCDMPTVSLSARLS